MNVIPASRPEENHVRPGQSLGVRFTLRNDGPEDLEPCLSKRESIRFLDVELRYAEAAENSVVDRPLCENPLFIPSGRSVSWSRSIVVRDRGEVKPE